MKKIRVQWKNPPWNDDKRSRVLFLALLLSAVTAFVNFCIPKGPAWLYVTLYSIATLILIVYMVLLFRTRKKG